MQFLFNHLPMRMTINDSITRTSWSRCYKKRDGNPNPDVNSLEEPKTSVFVTIGPPQVCASILYPRGYDFWRNSVTHHKKGIFLHAMGFSSPHTAISKATTSLKELVHKRVSTTA